MALKESNNKEFTISINLEGKELDEVYYEKEEKRLKIHLLPKKGKFQPDDVSLETDASENLNILKLAGRIISRLQKSQRGIFWAFALEDDLAKTQTLSSQINSVFNLIRENFSHFLPLAIFWQEVRSPAVIKGIFETKNPTLLKTLKENWGGEIKENRLFFEKRDKEPTEVIIGKFFGLINKLES